MTFDSEYELRDNGIYVRRGRFREQDWWEPCFEGAPDMCKKVYNLMEVVYNKGEHDGRKFVRDAIKDALNIEP